MTEKRGAWGESPNGPGREARSASLLRVPKEVNGKAKPKCPQGASAGVERTALPRGVGASEPPHVALEEAEGGEAEEEAVGAEEPEAVAVEEANHPSDAGVADGGGGEETEEGEAGGQTGEGALAV